MRSEGEGGTAGGTWGGTEDGDRRFVAIACSELTWAAEIPSSVEVYVGMIRSSWIYGACYDRRMLQVASND